MLLVHSDGIPSLKHYSYTLVLYTSLADLHEKVINQVLYQFVNRKYQVEQALLELSCVVNSTRKL